MCVACLSEGLSYAVMGVCVWVCVPVCQCILRLTSFYLIRFPWQQEVSFTYQRNLISYLVYF